MVPSTRIKIGWRGCEIVDERSHLERPATKRMKVIRVVNVGPPYPSPDLPSISGVHAYFGSSTAVLHSQQWWDYQESNK